MYTRLAHFARETESAFTHEQLIQIFICKQDKRVQKLVYPKFLIKYGGIPSVLQALMFVKHINKAICIEEVEKIALIQATDTSSSKFKHEVNSRRYREALLRQKFRRLYIIWSVDNTTTTRRIVMTPNQKKSKEQGKMQGIAVHALQPH